MIFRERSNSSYTVAAVVEDCEKESNIYYDFIVPLHLSQEQINNKRNQWLHVIFRTPDAGKTKRQMERVSLARGMECRDKVRVDSFAVVPQDGKGRDFSSSLFLPVGFCGDFLAVGVGRVGEFHRGVHLNLFGADA